MHAVEFSSFLLPGLSPLIDEGNEYEIMCIDFHIFVLPLGRIAEQAFIRPLTR